LKEVFHPQTKEKARREYRLLLLDSHGSHLIMDFITFCDENKIIMDCSRHNADSKLKYALYFDLLHSKMREYNVQPSNCYNMNKKGFMIGVLGCPKQVFS
jgi:hypothetical protein